MAKDLVDVAGRLKSDEELEVLIFLIKHAISSCKLYPSAASEMWSSWLDQLAEGATSALKSSIAKTCSKHSGSWKEMHLLTSLVCTVCRHSSACVSFVRSGLAQHLTSVVMEAARSDRTHSLDSADSETVSTVNALKCIKLLLFQQKEPKCDLSDLLFGPVLSNLSLKGSPWVWSCLEQTVLELPALHQRATVAINQLLSECTEEQGTAFCRLCTLSLKIEALQ
mmetsp:Transcript_4957/g.7955  ORF Transcript_4957/g.7955 Transcript_4957/m.7955 type:complete len:224 (-) Transcript_4957:362-1033(-)